MEILEICRRDPEAIIEEKLIEELTEQIDKNILDHIKNINM